MAGYIGVNNRTRKIKSGYVGVENTARKIVKGYIGINDIAYEIIMDERNRYWGNGSDGDVVISSSRTLAVNDSALNMCVINAKNFTVNSGVTLTVPRCNGLMILCKGDFILNGTISADKAAPFVNDAEAAALADMHLALLGDDVVGGASGDAGVSGFYNQLSLNMSGRAYPGGYGLGKPGNKFGGAPGAGSGSASPVSSYDVPTYLKGGDGDRAPVGTIVPIKPSASDAAMQYGIGGTADRDRYPEFNGGAGPGGSGSAVTMQPLYPDYTRVEGYKKVNGLNGDAFGGGAVYVFAAGNVIINGSIHADAGNGANGVLAMLTYEEMLTQHEKVYAVSGGGSGAGGGVIAVIYGKTLTNNGALSVAGGTGGLPGHLAEEDPYTPPDQQWLTFGGVRHIASAGADGSDGTTLIAHISELISNE